MNWALIAALVAASIAAVAHVAFFAMESLLFGRKDVWMRFTSSETDATAMKPMAFNQGFYNLFLAIGAGTGVVLAATCCRTVGETLIVFTCACMLGASVVLRATDRRFTQAAAMQGLPPLAALVLLGIDA